MSRKNGVHYSHTEIFEILQSKGLDAQNSEEIADTIDIYPFSFLDALVEALQMIRRGKP